jgi:hypothetical protein
MRKHVQIAKVDKDRRKIVISGEDSPGEYDIIFSNKKWYLAKTPWLKAIVIVHTPCRLRKEDKDLILELNFTEINRGFDITDGGCPYCEDPVPEDILFAYKMGC